MSEQTNMHEMTPEELAEYRRLQEAVAKTTQDEIKYLRVENTYWKLLASIEKAKLEHQLAIRKQAELAAMGDTKEKRQQYDHPTPNEHPFGQSKEAPKKKRQLAK